MTTSPYLYITTVYSYWRTSPCLNKLYNIQLQYFRAKFFYRDECINCWGSSSLSLPFQKIEKNNYILYGGPRGCRLLLIQVNRLHYSSPLQRCRSTGCDRFPDCRGRRRRRRPELIDESVAFIDVGGTEACRRRPLCESMWDGRRVGNSRNDIQLIMATCTTHARLIPRLSMTSNAATDAHAVTTALCRPMSRNALL